MLFKKASLERQMMAEIKTCAHVFDFPMDDAQVIARFLAKYNSGNDIVLYSYVAAPVLEKYPDLYNNWDRIMMKYKKLGLFPKWDVILWDDDDVEDAETQDSFIDEEIEQEDSNVEDEPIIETNADEEETVEDEIEEEIVEEDEIEEDIEEVEEPEEVDEIPERQLRGLKSLYDEGVLTEEEFIQKKRKLLGL